MKKGLLRVAIYFTFSMLASGASQVITAVLQVDIRYGDYILLVWGMAIFGRAAAFIINQAACARSIIALMVYVVISL